MKIVSKFQDYYDSGLAYGIDNNIFFKRVTKEENGPKEFYGSLREINTRGAILKSSKHTYNVNYLNYRSRISGVKTTLLKTRFLSFCGTRFPFICHEFEEPEKNSEGFTTRKKYYWNASDIPEKYRWNARYYDAVFKDESEFWEPVKDDSANIYWDSPIVIEVVGIFGIEVEINPCLKEIGFQNVVGPYDAFQQISMFIAGQLNKWEDPDLNPEPTEKEKLLSHGMDERYSFRHRKEA